MFRSEFKVFVVAMAVFMILLLLSFLSAPTIGGMSLREVHILGDILPKEKKDINIISRPQRSMQNSVAEAKAKADGRYQEYCPKGVTMITDYAEDKAGGMNHFYAMLDQVKQLDRPVRIAYYGDSFIEADILTVDLRELLQEKFGGCGIGWIDCEKGTNGSRPTVSLESKGFEGYLPNQAHFNQQAQGLNQKYYKAVQGATMHITASDFRKGASHWETVACFLAGEHPLTVEADINKRTTTQRQTSRGSGTVERLLFSSPNMKEMNLTFKGTSGNRLFGVALEGRQGVTVDNFGLRGNPGYTLSHVPVSTLKAFAAVRPYDLFIIHYGLNVVSDDNPRAFYQKYIRRMKETISHLRSAYPQASILVFSVSDRSQRTGNGVQTMKAIHELSASQEFLASESKVSYFNLFEAMGGKGSMQTYVDNGWANKDYTHINYEGGKRIARKIVDALLAGKENYERKKAAGIVQ